MIGIESGFYQAMSRMNKRAYSPDRHLTNVNVLHRNYPRIYPSDKLFNDVLRYGNFVDCQNMEKWKESSVDFILKEIGDVDRRDDEKRKHSAILGGPDM